MTWSDVWPALLLWAVSSWAAWSAGWVRGAHAERTKWSRMVDDALVALETHVGWKLSPEFCVQLLQVMRDRATRVRP